MASKKEQVLQAVKALLDGIAGPTVLRNEVDHEAIPAGGLFNLLDGNLGEPEAILSPYTLIYEHEIHVDVAVQGKAPADRDSAMDSLLEAIGTAVLADRTLSGLVDWLDPREPDAEEVDFYGGENVKAVRVPLIATYETTSPLN